MKILFIGGNGNISWYCVQNAIDRGHEVYLLNRSQTLKTRRDIQSEVHKITADIHDMQQMKSILSEATFDVVADFICYNENHAREAVELFAGHTKSFVYISSEAVYTRAGRNLPFKENCKQYNTDSVGDSYIAGKILAERFFMDAYRKVGFPITIIRPFHTYDTIMPVSIGQNDFSAPQKYLEGKPALIAGDGTTLRALTHSKDFASAFIPLLECRENIIGEDFHIATDEWLTWEEIMQIMFKALGLKEYRAIHIPYQESLTITCFATGEIARQRMFHMIGDTSKLKSYVPDWKAKVSFEEGIRETVAWLMEKPVRRRIIEKYDLALDELYRKYEV